MMGLLCIFLLSLGLFYTAFAAECIPETARCSKYWEKTLPHTNLMASEDELYSWCSKQMLFYQCLEDVLLDGKNGNLSYLPTNLLISKLFSEDLCTDGSKGRQRHLDNAECINQLDTGFCILPEYLLIVTPDDSIPSTRCSQAEKTFSCIAATIVLNCGFDAARVYRAMLKITRYSDEVCGIELSEGIPPCDESRSKSAVRNEKQSEIYYGLFHRIGNILDQNDDESEDESIPEEKDVAINLDNALTEAVQSMLDDLDMKSVSEECDEPDCINKLDSHSACTENITEHKPYMKNPIITEVLREILFYNYSGIEFAVYWRQPEFNVFDSFNCKHLVPSYMKVHIFRCRSDYRHNDPNCISNSTVHEKVTPEFIRDFDPEVPCDSVTEFGPRPNWMKELDQMYEDKKIRDQMTSTTQSTVTEAPEILTTGSTLLHIASTMSLEDFNKKWYEYDMKANNMNSPFPNDIHLEIMDLLMPDLKSWVPPEMNRVKIGDTMYFLMYNSEFGEKMENITCSRIDECHPNGRGLWRCRIWPRKIETCDTCGKIPPADTNYFGFQYARPSKQHAKMHGTKPIETVESEVTQTPSDESITVVSGTEYETQSLVGIESTDEPVDDFQFINDEGYSVDEHKDSDLKDIHEMDIELISDSQDPQIGVKVLTSLPNEDGENEVVYAIHDSEDGESEVILTEDGLLAGKVLFIKDESDFENKYIIVTTPDAEQVL